jgi:catechol 2,3-dioxygenase-like lactoylglutathione lyase family enzyme
MIKPKSIDHIVLRTDRYQELIAFYSNVIGCSLERETSDALGLTQLRAGNSLIDIVDVNGKLGVRRQNLLNLELLELRDTLAHQVGM